MGIRAVDAHWPERRRATASDFNYRQCGYTRGTRLMNKQEFKEMYNRIEDATDAFITRVVRWRGTAVIVAALMVLVAYWYLT